MSGLDDMDTFQSEMAAAGFNNIRIEPIVHSFPVEGPDEFWDSMVKGSAPIVSLKSKMDADVWNEKEKISKQYLRDNLKGATALSSKASFGIGTK